jgi:hypothetical protein
VVRQRSLVNVAACAGVLLSVFAFAADDSRPTSPPAPAGKTSPKKKPAATPGKATSASTSAAPASGAKGAVVPVEWRPYKIRAWVSVDPDSRIDARGRDRLIADWRSLVRRFVGAPWVLEVASDEGPLATETLEGLQPASIVPLIAGYDKAWAIRVEPEDNGVAFVGREYDVSTARIGPACRRAAPYPADASRALLGLAIDLFEPSAEIGAKVGGDVLVTVRGAALAPASPVGRVVTTGSVFRPLRVWQRPDGSVLKIEDIRRSFLRVVELNGAVARCNIVSSSQDPLSSRVARKNTLVALGVKRGSVATRYRYFFASDKTPAAGYILTARTVPDGPPVEVGMTDREGRISIPPGFADGLVIFRLLAANIEPVDEFPAMPGETVDERPVVINPKPAAVALETQLNSLRDDLIDVVATRARIESRLKARAEGEKWDEVEELLDEYRKLTPRDEYAAQLTKMKEDAARQQTETKAPILTRTAQGLITDTQALMDRYLDDEIFKAYAAALASSKSEGVKGQPQKALAKGARGSATPPPSAASKTAAPPVASTPDAPPATAPPAPVATQPAPTPTKRANAPAAGAVPF